MLSSYLIKSGNKVINSNEDADTEIARCAVHVAETGRRFNVVADDTDVALLLFYHWKSGMANITFTSEKSTFDISSSLSEMLVTSNHIWFYTHEMIVIQTPQSIRKERLR